MTFAGTVLVTLLALAIDAAFGYPDWLLRRVGHPVTWIGALIAALDTRLNGDALKPAERRLAGVAALLITVAAVAAVAWAIEHVFSPSPLGQLALAALASTLIASRSLFDHVREVAVALEGRGLDAARQAVGRIVGRNPETLDEAGVARAAIESLAENASDGVVAPTFWFLLLGLPGLAAYKAINTADSMIGHRTPRHEAFGWASARLDDLVNLPASRLTGLLFAGAALLEPGASPKNAVRAMLRDAGRHRSPNAGWPESAMAGALGLRLNGPKTYGNVLVNDAYMGDGRRDANAGDIHRALGLAGRAWSVMVAGLLAVALILRA